MHLLRLSQQKPQDVTPWGWRLKATQSNFPALKNLSLYRVSIQPGAAREPHWHANADELGYCISGNILVSLYGNENCRSSFAVAKGEAFFIPSGALHSIEVIGESPCDLILCFSHEEPEDFALSVVFGMFSNAVLGNTWGLPASHFSFVQRPGKEVFIGNLKENPSVENTELYASNFRFSLEASTPLISNSGGEAKVARKNVWPILKSQALYSLRLTGDGMREPHWHPETAELGFVAEGKGRMSIQSPSGQIDTYVMQEGDLYFIPKAYPHHIENLNNTDLHLCIFFDQPMPEDIGFTGSIRSFPETVLQSSLKAPPEAIKQMPIYFEDSFIVTKFNP